MRAVLLGGAKPRLWVVRVGGTNYAGTGSGWPRKVSRIASRAPIPRRRAVSMTERTSAWSFAPQTERKQLVTLRKTALQRNACSEPLLVGEASGSARKTNSLSCHLSRLRRNFSAARLPTIGCATISESARKWRQKKDSITPGPQRRVRRAQDARRE